MAKSGFVPAWMKISSSDKTNRQRHHSSDIIDHTTNQQQSSSDLENLFSFQSRRSYSREHLANSFGKNSELNSNNDYSSNQRRLHSVSSLRNNNEKDFPSLNGRDLSSNNNEKSSIWSNAASKFRIPNNEISSFKYFDRSLSTNHGRTFGSNRLIPRKDRLLSSPNNLNIQTNCITQTKNLDKRSDFLNSLKHDLTIEEQNHYKQSSKGITNEKFQKKKGILLLLSVPETSEEKEFLIRMGWNDDMTYEITDKDKEEYEKRIKLLPKTDNRSAVLMSALNRRTLPCINIRDVLRLEMINSPSDDDSSDE